MEVLEIYPELDNSGIMTSRLPSILSNKGCSRLVFSSRISQGRMKLDDRNLAIMDFIF